MSSEDCTKRETNSNDLNIFLKFTEFFFTSLTILLCLPLVLSTFAEEVVALKIPLKIVLYALVKRIHYNYSMKNIPTPSEKLCKTTSINKVEVLIKGMRLIAHLTDSNYIGHANPLFYMFKSRKCPPQKNELIYFENDLLELVKNATFRKIYNIFHDQLNKDINSIRQSNIIFIFAGKAQNLYETSKEN